MDWLEQGVGAVGELVGRAMPPGDLHSLLVDGVIAGVGAVIVFLPQILMLFLFIGLLEDTGYMARAAFLMDRVMSKVGLHGKSFIPMLSSFACAIPGIMATRTIEQAPEVAAQLKSNQKDLAEYHHAQAQKSKKPEDYSAASRWYRAMLDSFPDDDGAPGTRYLLGEVLFESGRFAEAAVAEAEAWSSARDLSDREREVWAIADVGMLYSGMGQWTFAMRYFERARELAEERNLANAEFLVRINLAHCAIQLREPASGLRALAKFCTDAPTTRFSMGSAANAHNNLARLYLLVDDLSTAKVHAEESARFAKIARQEKATRQVEGTLGLIDVRSGAVDRGLSTLNRALTRAKCVDHTEVPDYLGMCVEGYEAAGHLDKALGYLQELVEWKKKSIDVEVVPLEQEGLADSIQVQTGISLFDGGLLAKSQSLQMGVRDRIQRLVETAINAEIAGGCDLYRTFRIARLARYLAAAIGWDEQRIAPLALGAQLCNIGMIAIPARILQKPRGLSDGERHVLCDHTRYGAELLRKSRVRILDVASVIAEQHHERYDGSGYPLSLGGEAIAEEARIVAVCDAFDAMTHSRPWRVAPLPIQSALNELKQGAGTQFDPLLVTAFVDLIEREFWEHDDFDAFLAEGADQLEYVRARMRMEAFIADRG
jgi:response regulator RpfG family c-di-GMP phosphodiesterase